MFARIERDANAFYRVACVASDARMHKEALSAIEEALRLQPDVPKYSTLKRVFEQALVSESSKPKTDRSRSRARSAARKHANSRSRSRSRSHSRTRSRDRTSKSEKTRSTRSRSPKSRRSSSGKRSGEH